MEIVLPISGPLKRSQKEAILADLKSPLSGVPHFEVVGTKYRESYGAEFPLELIVEITTVIANAIVMVGALWTMKKWISKQGNADSSPGIDVVVDGQSYSIKHCKTAEDVRKIIREIKHH